MKFIFCSAIFLLMTLIGCSNKDEQLKADIATKSQQDISFAGVDYTVQNGEAVLSGNCATAQDKQEVEKTVKGIAGIKQVQSNIVIAPVVLNGDEMLKRSAEQQVKDYPRVKAEVKDSVITLIGSIKKDDEQKLLNELNTVHAKGVKNELTLQ